MLSKLNISIEVFQEFLTSSDLTWEEQRGLSDHEVRSQPRIQQFIHQLRNFLKKHVQLSPEITEISFKSIEKHPSTGIDTETVITLPKLEFLLLFINRIYGSLDSENYQQGRLYKTGYLLHHSHRYTFNKNFNQIVYPTRTRLAILWSDYSSSFRINHGATTKCSFGTNFDMFTITVLNNV